MPRYGRHASLVFHLDAVAIILQKSP
jgi:hypothetical protein